MVFFILLASNELSCTFDRIISIDHFVAVSFQSIDFSFNCATEKYIHGSMECMNLSHTQINTMCTVCYSVHLCLKERMDEWKRRFQSLIRAFSLLLIQKLMKFETNAFLNWTKLTFYIFTFLFVSKTHFRHLLFSIVGNFSILLRTFHRHKLIATKWVTTRSFSLFQFLNSKGWRWINLEQNYCIEENMDFMVRFDGLKKSI